ncbi:MAG: sugar transferase [FCB group bacterium]|nr:sugar transferase [FCB group bacterium]
MDQAFIRNNERRVLIIADITAFVIAWYSTYFLSSTCGWFSTSEGIRPALPAAVLVLFWLPVYTAGGRYRPQFRLSQLDSVVNIVKTTGAGILIILLFLTITNFPPIFGGKVSLALYGVLLAVFSGWFRYVLKKIQRSLFLSGKGLSPSLVVSYNNWGKKLCDQIRHHPETGYRMVGFAGGGDDAEAGYLDPDYLGPIGNLKEIISENDISELIVVSSPEQEKLLDRVIAVCSGLGVSVKVIPDLNEINIGQVKPPGRFNLPLREVFPDNPEPGERWLKRIWDIAVSLIILILAIPLSLVVAIAIKLDTPGPITYKQTRLGKDGRKFRMYKFRSMVLDAEKHTGAVWAGKNDPRITAVGRFLRKTRIDEMPQFVNILTGSMSLVGPRPEREVFVEKFIATIPLYRRRLLVKPGLTGWAQVKHKYDESPDDVKSKLAYDLFYLDNMSFALDVKIVLMTIFVILKGKGH